MRVIIYANYQQSRSKNDNPEQAKMREKAKILHQKQMEIDQRKNADQTALYAIGNKRRKIQSGQNNYVGGVSVENYKICKKYTI